MRLFDFYFVKFFEINSSLSLPNWPRINQKFIINHLLISTLKQLQYPFPKMNDYENCHSLAK